MDGYFEREGRPEKTGGENICHLFPPQLHSFFLSHETDSQLPVGCGSHAIDRRQIKISAEPSGSSRTTSPRRLAFEGPWFDVQTIFRRSFFFNCLLELRKFIFRRSLLQEGKHCGIRNLASSFMDSTVVSFSRPLYIEKKRTS